MAGQYADVLAEQMLQVNRIHSMATTAGSVTALKVLHVNKRTAINQITIAHATDPGSTLIVKASRAGAGVAGPTDSTDAGGGYFITSGDDMDTGAAHTAKTLTLVTSKGVPSQNILEAGDSLWLASSGNLSGIGQFSVEVRMTEVIK